MKYQRRRSIALAYRPEEDAAPKVTAKGDGLIADRIVELAKESGVPVRRDPDLVQLLSVVDVMQDIPETLYGVVAEVLAFAWRANERRRQDTENFLREE